VSNCSKDQTKLPSSPFFLRRETLICTS